MYKNNLKNCVVSCFSNVINGLRPVNIFAKYVSVLRYCRTCSGNLDYRIKSVNDKGDGGKRFAGLCSRMTVNLTFPSGGEVTRLLRCARNDIHCLGRSMIEMLGVLAIVGVLSVGGIAGYSKAMTKWKINKTISDYTYFMFKSIEHLNDLYKIPSEEGYADIAKSLDMLPDSWNYVDSRNVRDALDYRIQMWNIGNELVFEIYLFEANSSKSLQHKRFCQEIFSNFAKPLSTFIHSIYLWRSNAPSSVRFYGDSYCGEGKKCLKDITLSEIDSLCGMSMVDEGGSSIVLHY